MEHDIRDAKQIFSSSEIIESRYGLEKILTNY